MTSYRTFPRLVGSSLIVLTSVVGCSGAKLQQRPALASTQGEVISSDIEGALKAHDFARALTHAERLVEAKPREAAYRTLLGRAYLANGLYRSAGAAFEDALTLGADDPRTLVSLSLVRSALGDAQGARDLLAAHISDLPAADYGLAMTMAGDVNEGVRALLEAVRLPDADAKTRQNLAYALALAGNWGQARLVAGQDLTGSALQQRLAEWAATAQSEAVPQRVAALVGVAPRADDNGMPERLALNHSAPAALAHAEPAAPVDMATRAAADLPPAPPPAAQLQPAPAPAASADAPAQMATAILQPRAEPPLLRAPSGPIRQPVEQRAFATPAAASLVTANGQTTSDWVVQIGAFSDHRGIAAGWNRARTLEQQGYRKVTGTIAINGRTWHRLAFGGFSDRGAALTLCTTLRAQGSSCFVRRDEGLASTMRMANAKAQPGKAQTLASR